MSKGNYFTLQSLINHVTNQVVMADAGMQLVQGETWQELTKDLPLAAGSSHLKFLGLDEIEFSFNLSEKRPNYMNRVLIWTKLAKPSERMIYKVKPAKKSAYHLKITIKRTANKRFKADTSTNIPQGINIDNTYLISEQ